MSKKKPVAEKKSEPRSIPCNLKVYSTVPVDDSTFSPIVPVIEKLIHANFQLLAGILKGSGFRLDSTEVGFCVTPIGSTSKSTPKKSTTKKKPAVKKV